MPLWLSLTSGEDDDDDGDGRGDGSRNAKSRRAPSAHLSKSAPKQDALKSTHVTYLYGGADQTPEKISSEMASPHTDDGYVVTSISELERQKRLSPDGDLWYCGPKSDSDGSTTKLLKHSGKVVAQQLSDTDLFSSRCVLCACVFLCTLP